MRRGQFTRVIPAASSDAIMILHRHFPAYIDIAMTPPNGTRVSELTIRAGLPLFRFRREGRRACGLGKAELARGCWTNRAVKTANVFFMSDRCRAAHGYAGFTRRCCSRFDPPARPF